MLATLPELNKIPCIVHGFTLRKLADGSKFNLNLYNNEQAVPVKENLKKLKNLIGFPSSPVVTCHQVHKKNVVKVDLAKKNPQEIRKIEGDALITNQPYVIISILTADCLPILLFDKKNKAIGAIHAGKKGTMLSITDKVIEQMNIHFGSKPENIMAGIGPGIKKCCYEVDILEENIEQMKTKGLLKKNIFSLNQCTSCKKEMFFSYRAEKGKTGRMLAFIMLKNI